MFQLFIILAIFRFINKKFESVDTDATANPNKGNNVIQSYYPLTFHSLVIVSILISCFTPSLLNGEKIHALVADGMFQFVSTLLLFIISMINPFISFSDENRQRIEQSFADKNNGAVTWLLRGHNWQFLKLLACILIVGYFIYNGYLVFPSLDQGLVSGVIIFLIIFFVFTNIVQLIRNPILYKKQVLYRLSMLYKSIKLSFFVSISIIISIYIIALMLKLDITTIVNLEGIALLVYNIVMASNEYKILNAFNE